MGISHYAGIFGFSYMPGSCAMHMFARDLVERDRHRVHRGVNPSRCLRCLKSKNPHLLSTTAKPSPAAPALTASICALSAKVLSFLSKTKDILRRGDDLVALRRLSKRCPIRFPPFSSHRLPSVCLKIKEEAAVRENADATSLTHTHSPVAARSRYSFSNHGATEEPTDKLRTCRPNPLHS